MSDIEKLKQEAEEARQKLMSTMRIGWYPDSCDLADGLIAATIAQIALQAAEKEAKPNIEGQIISEIYKACELLGAKSDLLGTIGSWRDTMSDEHTLDTLKLLNEHYSKPAPIADDGWIKWHGRQRNPPMDGTKIVEIKFRDESTAQGIAGEYYWDYLPGADCEADIIAYRIIQPAADRVSGS